MVLAFPSNSLKCEVSGKASVKIDRKGGNADATFQDKLFALGTVNRHKPAGLMR